MRISCKMFATFAVLGLWSGAGYSIRAQTHPAAAELIQKLQSDKTTDEARKEVLQLTASDPNIRRYLAVDLPVMIQAGPESCPQSDIVDLDAKWHSCPWYNAVELAGQLRIDEAAPALTRWINWRTTSMVVSPSSEAKLTFYPAARALYKIGDPSIPALQGVLNSGSTGEHGRAVRVLCIIRTPKAKAVLQDDLQRELDPDLQQMIKNTLRE